MSSTSSMHLHDEAAHRRRKAHLVRRALHEAVWYPAHAPRSESPEYAAKHHQLVVVEDRPCFICGVKNSTLADPEQNPHGAREMETHHLYVEWALINATDPEKLAAQFGPLPQDYSDWAAFLDHDEENLLVLCDVHHRHKEAGIHEMSYPIWVAQKFVRDDYTLTLTQDSSSSSARSNA